MAISIDWIAKIISVPKVTPEMTLVQSVPTVIYDLDLNAFHITLRDLEASVGGAPWATTHTHNGEATLSGLTYARLIEIIGGYTVTFEDDQYAVNLVGANSNVADVTNVNQVSVRPQNAAGLISSPAIEYASFNDKVTIDDSLTTSGTGYNLGTPGNPVGNVADALLIAAFRGFTKLSIVGDITFDTPDDIRNFFIEGESAEKSAITVNAGALVSGAEFSECTLSGTLDGNSVLDHCHTQNLNFVEGEVRHCLLHGTITLGGSGDSQFLGCWSGVPGAATPVIDCGGSGRELGIRGYSGGIKLVNKTGSEAVSMDFTSGHAVLDSTVTNGTIVIRGADDVTNNATGTAIVIIPGDRHIDDILQLIESQRGHHTATGTVFYWNPINGSDANDGLSKDAAKLTWGGASGANSLVTAYAHDVVMILPGEAAGLTAITEQIVLDKEYTFIRGPGRDVVFRPTAMTGETVSIEGEGCELSGCRIETAATGDGEALIVTGDFCWIHNVWVELSQADGIRIQNVSRALLEKVAVRNCARDGVVFRGTTQDCKNNMLSDAVIDNNAGHGVVFEGEFCTENFVWGGKDGVIIMHNGGWGILERTGADVNHATGPVIHIHDNTLGEFQFTGADSLAENVGALASFAQADRNAALIERGRGGHTWSGEVFYVDPINGDTIANGAKGTKAGPLSTVQECHDSLVVDNRHDVIILVPGSAAGETLMTEAVTISKRYVFINGPGRDFRWTRAGAGDTISVTADGCELSGFQLETAAVGAGNGVTVSSADFVSIHDVFVDGTQGDAINISNSFNIRIENNDINMSGVGGSGHGIVVDPAGGSSDEINIRHNHISSVTGNGIWIKGASVNGSNVVANEIHDCTGWGLIIEEDVIATFVARNEWGNNGNGNFSDSGTRTIDLNNQQWLHAGQVIEGTDTLEEMLRIFLGSLTGLTTVEKNTPSDGLTRVTFKSRDGLIDRAIVTHDGKGVRSISVLDGS